MRVSEFVYGVLLGAYPKEFRDAYGRELEQAFADLYREASRRGGVVALARLWARVLLDSLISCPSR